MAVLKWSRLEEEVDVTSLAGNETQSRGWNLVRNLGASIALLVLVLFLVISRSEQQGLNQTLEFTLNSTIEKAVRLRDELQEVGERVNSANSEVANLQASLARLSTRVSHITPFFELSFTLLTTHAIGLYEVTKKFHRRTQKSFPERQFTVYNAEFFV